MLACLGTFPRTAMCDEDGGQGGNDGDGGAGGAGVIGDGGGQEKNHQNQ